MKSFKATIIDPLGLHVRPASVLSSKMAKYKSKVTLKVIDGATADVKSIINLMSLAIKQNTEVELSAQGEDEEEAINELRKVLEENKLI